MKKMPNTRYCAGPPYYRISTDVYCSKQTGSSSQRKGAITIISSFLELGQKKTVDAAKICGGAESVVKTKPRQTFADSCSVLLL